MPEGAAVKEVDRNIAKTNARRYISLREYILGEQLPLTIVGYPSQRFKTVMNFEKAIVKRS